MSAAKHKSSFLLLPWLVVLLSVALLASGEASAGQHKDLKRTKWTPEAFPNPQKEARNCGRPAGVAISSICDPEGILSTEQQNMVDGLINEIASGTSPFKKAQCGDQQAGFQVAVAIFHRMNAGKHADKAVAAQHFARALHDQWGVGNPKCQNGAVLLIAIGDKQAYISAGAGVKAVVSDSQLLGVLEAAKPAMKHKRYAEAVLSCVQQLGLLLSGQEPEPGGVDSEDGLAIFLFFAATVSAVVGWAWLSNRKQHRRYKACADKLAAIKRDQTAIRSRQYAATSCPICLEDFDVPLTAAGAAAAARAAATAHAPVPAPATPATAAAGAGPSPSASVASSSRAGSSSRGTAGGSGGAAASGSSGVAKRTAAAAAGDALEDGSGEVSPSAPLLGGSGGASSSSNAAAAEVEAPGSASKNKKGSSKGSEKKSEGRQPLVLRCGHAFCDPCITKWLDNHTSCPICRQDLDAPDEQQQAPSSDGRDSSSNRSADECGRGLQQQQPAEDAWRRQVWLPELGFRLRRLRLLYPDMVTDPMLYAWEEDIAADRDLDTTALQVFDPARQQQLEQSGRQGANSFAHFGGGSSAGGGGAGTSW